MFTSNCPRRVQILSFVSLQRKSLSMCSVTYNTLYGTHIEIYVQKFNPPSTVKFIISCMVEEIVQQKRNDPVNF